MIADKGVFVRNFQFLGETERGIIARVWHRNNDVGLDRKLACEFATHFGAHFANIDAAEDAVRSREINVFEHAKGRLLRLKRKLRTHSVFVDDQNLTGLNFANELGVN